MELKCVQIRICTKDEDWDNSNSKCFICDSKINCFQIKIRWEDDGGGKKDEESSPKFGIHLVRFILRPLRISKKAALTDFVSEDLLICFQIGCKRKFGFLQTLVWY